MQSTYDVIIIGAGPAGMSAAVESARHGASVCILDEQPCAGGQIYRNVSNVDHLHASILGRDYFSGRSLVEGLAGAQVDHRAEKRNKYKGDISFLLMVPLSDLFLFLVGHCPVLSL